LLLYCLAEKSHRFRPNRTDDLKKKVVCARQRIGMNLWSRKKCTQVL